MKSVRFAFVGVGSLVCLAACGPAPGVVVEPPPPAPVVEYVTRQEILTPLPMRVRLPVAYGAEHVVVFFKTWGSRGWAHTELARQAPAAQTWSGEISCREVSTVTGDTSYYFVVFDADGEVVGGSGTHDWPHVATVVRQLPDGAQSLPGYAALRCHDPADCPPDFPGCPAYAFHRRACLTYEDCKDGRACAWDGYCGSPSQDVVRDDDGNAEEEELEAAVRNVKRRLKKTASR